MTGSPDEPVERAGPGATVIDVLLSIVIPVVVVGGLFLSPYLRNPEQLPFGADTFGYVWRTNLVYADGVGALASGRIPRAKMLGERPAVPVVLSLLRGVTGRTGLDLMYVLPAVLAGALAAAVAAMASSGAGERFRLVGPVAVGVAGSAFIAWTALGYSSNLALDVTAMAAGALTIRVAFGAGRREIVAALILLAGGALFHWIFAALFLVLLLGFAALLALRHVVGPESGRPPRDAAKRVATVVLGSVILASLWFVLAPELPGRAPHIRGAAGTERETDRRLPAMALPVTLPLAFVGAIVIGVARGRPQRRWSLGVLVPWAALALVGIIGWNLLHIPLAPYRWAGFSLGIPLLVVLGALGLRLLRAGAAVQAASIALALAAAAALAHSGYTAWSSFHAVRDEGLFAALDTVSRYVEPLPDGTRLIFPFDVAIRPDDPVWAGLPASRLDDVVFERLTAGWLLADVDAEPGDVVVILANLNHTELPVVGTELGPGIVVIGGPPLVPAEEPTPSAPSAARLVGVTLACLATLWAAGAGWAIGLTRLPIAGALALAPALGLATLGTVGLMASRLGMPLRGMGAVAVIGFDAVAGIVIAIAWRGPLGSADRPAEPAPVAHGEM